MKILITGSSSGIAFFTGCVLLTRGHEVYMTTKTDKEVESLKEKLKYLEINTSVFKLDITLEEDRKKINNLNLDVLFLHAGVGYAGLLKDIDIDLVRDNFNVNVFSNLAMIQEYLNINDSPKKIVVTSSLLAGCSFPFLGSYVMSKTTIDIMMDVLRKENIFTKNKFITIKPGAYHTGFNQYMILSGEKNGVSSKLTKILNNIFILIEEKSLNSIVEKIVLAIEKGDKDIYSAPFIQNLLTKLTF